MEKDTKGMLLIGSPSDGKLNLAETLREHFKTRVNINLSNPDALKNVSFSISGPVAPQVVEELRWVLEQVTPKTGPKP